jgi:hypothetical protein
VSASTFGFVRAGNVTTMLPIVPVAVRKIALNAVSISKNGISRGNDRTMPISAMAADEDHDPRCLQPMPCLTHNYREYSLIHRPYLVMDITPCPYCGGSGPGGVWSLNGELSYGNGRWECKDCGKGILGKVMRDQ